MNPHDALTLLTNLQELFGQFLPAQRDVVERMLEKFPREAGVAAVSRLAEESSVFDRGRLHILLLEEHGRRHRPVPMTAAWRVAKEAEVKAIDEALNKTPKDHLDEIIGELQKTQPNLFKLLRSDPLESDLGRSLIYRALRGRETANACP